MNKTSYIYISIYHHVNFTTVYSKDVDVLKEQIISYHVEEIKQLPKNTKHIMFLTKFNKSVDHLPDTITHITFGHDFDQKVDHLPNTITNITFGYYFNQSVDYLPKKTKYIKFGHYFNKSVDHLPKNVEHILFGCLFNQSFDYLPKKIIHVELIHAKHIHIYNSLKLFIKSYSFYFTFPMRRNIINYNFGAKNIIYRNKWSIVKKDKIPYGCNIICNK